MAFENDYTNDPAVTSQLWNQYYGNVTTPSDVPYGFQFNQNQVIADALRGYGQDPYLTEATYMPGYEDTLTRKLIEKNAAGTTTTAQPARQQSSMPNMNMLQSMMGGSGFAPSAAASTPGSAPMDFNAGFGTTGGSVVNAGASSVPMGAGDFAGSTGASTSGGGLMDFGSSFGSTGSSAVTPGTASAGADATGGMFSNLGMGGGGTGAAYGGAAGGALMGYMQGRDNYKNDPNMWNGKDGYGKYHKDYRAEVGGGTLGGVLGWYGGPIGALVAGPVVKEAHKVMEPATREVINFGDKVGGSSGALALDPIGTVASGKYSWGELGKGALLGPATKWFKL